MKSSNQWVSAKRPELQFEKDFSFVTAIICFQIRAVALDRVQLHDLAGTQLNLSQH